MMRRVRYIGEPGVPLTESYPRGVLFVGRKRRNDEGRIELRIDGTAFLVGVRGDPPSHIHIYAVTAAHVVQGPDDSFVRMPMRSGEPLDLDVPEWMPHPQYDVAVAPVVLPPGNNIAFTELAQFVDDDHWVHDPYWPQEFELHLGDTVYFIGLLRKVEAMTRRATPIVRSGTLGALWQEQVPVKRTPVDAVKYITAHLIDCRSFGGFSGSPCYVEQSRAGVLQDGGVRITSKHRVALLGLIGGHFDDWARTRARPAEWEREEPREEDYVGGISDNIEAPVSTGVGYVIPAEYIRETLMLEELTTMREELDKAGDEDPATMDSAAEPNEFERFEDLSRKLVKVPKKELDEKRREEP